MEISHVLLTHAIKAVDTGDEPFIARGFTVFRITLCELFRLKFGTYFPVDYIGNSYRILTSIRVAKKYIRKDGQLTCNNGVPFSLGYAIVNDEGRFHHREKFFFDGDTKVLRGDDVFLDLSKYSCTSSIFQDKYDIYSSSSIWSEIVHLDWCSVVTIVSSTVPADVMFRNYIQNGLAICNTYKRNKSIREPGKFLLSAIEDAGDIDYRRLYELACRAEKSANSEKGEIF